MQREREAFHVGALTNMTALTGKRVVIFVIRNLSVPEWHLMLANVAIKTIISVSPNWWRVLTY